MKIKGVILDNDQSAVIHLKNLISHFDNIEIVGAFNKAIDASQFINGHNVDVLFIDINLSLVNGIAFIKSIQIETKIIVTSKLKEFAIDCFEFGVLDFLVKPIGIDRFLKSINRLQTQIAKKKTNQNETAPYIFIKDQKKFIKINVRDILYIESQKDYIKVQLKTKSFLTLGSLTSFCEELPDYFLRVHRSFCISKNYVDALNGNMIEINAFKIPIGRHYIKTVKSQILINTFQN